MLPTSAKIITGKVRPERVTSGRLDDVVTLAVAVDIDRHDRDPVDPGKAFTRLSVGFWCVFAVLSDEDYIGLPTR